MERDEISGADEVIAWWWLIPAFLAGVAAWVPVLVLLARSVPMFLPW